MSALFPAILLRRYKRFLADVRLPSGEEITVHCPNTGSMRECVVPQSPCWFSISDSKTRKYPHTLEVVTTPSGHWAGINTSRANTLVSDALATARFGALAGYTRIQREQRYGDENSRIDFLLSGHPTDERDCYLEVKSVTLMEGDGMGYFPDAVSERGAKHLRELIAMREAGYRAVLVFCVQHTGICQVSAARHIDVAYADGLAAAAAAGVEVMALAASIVPEQSHIELDRIVPVIVS